MQEEGKAIMAGNGDAHAPADQKRNGPQENIFLFWPNLIGTHECPASAIHFFAPPKPRMIEGAQEIWSGWHQVSAGYSRIVLAFASLYYMPLHPRTCSLLYSISCLLDALDGYAARHFEQSTRFGAVLDMVTDRCTTSCLLVFLSSAFPRWAIIFQGLISLDFASHYMHMYATLAMGGSDTSHKNVDKSRSWVLNLYYTNKVRFAYSRERVVSWC
jgi:CDP-diacylglycerol--inositol 3-phosphatidyltransferase